MNTSIKICDFGTAPEQKKLGYQLSGFEICCRESELLSLLRFAGDVCAVRGGSTGNEEEIFHVMVKREDAPIKYESIQTVDDMIVQVKQGVDSLEMPSYKIDISKFTNGERAIMLAELSASGYHAYCDETTLKCKKLP
jgi:hypothetical protein